MQGSTFFMNWQTQPLEIILKMEYLVQKELNVPDYWDSLLALIFVLPFPVGKGVLSECLNLFPHMAKCHRQYWPILL